MVESSTIKITKIAQSKIHTVDFDNIPFGRVFSDHMFMAEYKGGQWTNMRIVPYGAMQISPAISALHYGQSIFEGLKAYRAVNKKVHLFRPYENLKRMQLSAERMCMPKVTEEVFIDGLKHLLEIDANWVPDHENNSLYIRPFQFATDEYVGIRPSDNYLFVIFFCPVGAYYSEPVKVKVETRYSRSMEGGTGFAKTAGNYAAALYPAKLAQNQGFHQLVWTDSKTHQFIEESGTMNVMFLINDTLITPPAQETILKGVTRDSVLTLVRDMGISVEERPVKVEEIEKALINGNLIEAFGTGTAATIANIAEMNINGSTYVLPKVDDSSLSRVILTTLENIKRGKIEDTHNWILAL